MSRARRWAQPIAGLAITVVFVVLLRRQLQGADVAAALGRVAPAWIAAGLLALAAGYALRIVRWWLMLRAIDPRVRAGACIRPFLVSIAVNNLLPFRAGDALRVVGFRDELQAPPMRVLGTLLVERLLDLMTLLIFFFVGLSGTAPGRIPAAFVTGAIWTAAAGAAVVLILLIVAGRLAAWLDALAAHPAIAARPPAAWLFRHLGHLAGILAALHTPALTARLALLSFGAWLCEGAVFVAVARGLALDVPARGPLFALATGTLATLIPSSPGYVGTFDFFASLGLVAYGAPADVAATFAIVVHLVLWLPLTLAGVAYVLRPGGAAIRRRVAGTISGGELS